MLTLAQARPDTARAAPPAGCGRRTLSFRSVRPSLLDLRFTGDPTVVDVRRMVLFVGHDFTERLRLYAELEVEHAIASSS